MTGNPANSQRHLAASRRDVQLAGLIWDAWERDVFTMTGGQEKVVRARLYYPDKTWQETADMTGMTKNRAWGLWRRVVARYDKTLASR